eukprot:scaffold53_cov193-Pinguiococcus_pyrenoidosus.AAC.44
MPRPAHSRGHTRFHLPTSSHARPRACSPQGKDTLQGKRKQRERERDDERRKGSKSAKAKAKASPKAARWQPSYP